MADFRSDLNPPPKFENDNELPVGYVGASTMPGPVVSTDNEQPKLERVKEKDPNKGNQIETGTYAESEKELPDQGKTRDEKPSFIHGTENIIAGSLKEAIGKVSGKEEIQDKGRKQKEYATSESHQENNFDNKYE